jgi:hypothetical protein
MPIKAQRLTPLEQGFQDAVGWWGSTESDRLALVCMDDPRFDEAGRVHDWRNYVPDLLKNMWAGLPREAKIVAAWITADRARAEDWD